MAENPLKLEIETVVNDNKMDDSIRKIQSKLKDIEGLSTNRSNNTTLSPQAQQQKTAQDKILQDAQKRYLKEMQDEHRAIGKLINENTKLYQKENIALKEKEEIQDRIVKLKTKEAEIMKGMERYGAKPAGVKTETPGVTPPGDDKGTDQQTLLKKVAGAFGVASIIGTVSKLGLTALEQEKIKETQKTAVQASAIVGASRPVKEIYEGRGYEGQFFAKERQQAMDMASKQTSKQEMIDNVKIAMPVILGAVGAVAGSMFGPGGTAIGWKAGASIGGMMGVGVAASSLDRSYAKVMDNKRYQSMLAAETMQQFEQSEAQLKASNVPASQAMATQRQRGGDLLAIERAAGFGTSQAAMSGLKESMTYGGNQYGFENIKANLSAMQQAGATSEDLRGGLAGQAAAAQQYGVSNAAGIMGRLSSVDNRGMGTDEAFRRVMATAVQTGVDASKLAEMPQELNRFATLASEIATSGGGFSESAMQRFAASITDMKSATSMQGAKSYAEQFQKQAGTVVGMEGQMGYAILEGDEVKGILGEESHKKMMEEGLLFTMNKVTQKELEENPEFAEGLARKMNTDVPTLMKAVAVKDEGKPLYTKDLSESAKKSRKARQQYGEEQKDLKEKQASGKPLTEEEQKKLNTPFEKTEEGIKANTDMTIALGELNAETRYGADTRAKVRALSFAPGDEESFKEEGDKLVKTVQGKKGTDAEKIRASGAVGDIAQMDNLNRFLAGFGAAAELVDSKTAMFEQAMTLFADTLKTGGKEAMDEFKKSIKDAYGEKPPPPPPTDPDVLREQYFYNYKYSPVQPKKG
jgi:hypothetical protein